MEDVAARAGVSRALVSIVFREVPGASEETRKRIRTAADELGYRPDRRARLLSRRKTRLIGVAFGVGAPFHNELIIQLYAMANELDYELVLSGITPQRTEVQAVHELQSLRCDAVILLGPTTRRSRLAELAVAAPTVVVARAVVDASFDTVRTDDFAGARLATDHLIELGHRRIVHVDGGRAPGAADRRRGYQASMRAAGMGDSVRILAGGPTEQEGGLAGERWVAEQRDPTTSATAATVFNDSSAAGFVDLVRSVGLRVPADVSVVGFDNSRLAQSRWLDLTTVAQDTEQLSRAVLVRALARVAGRQPERPLLIAPSLLVRGSTRPA